MAPPQLWAMPPPRAGKGTWVGGVLRALGGCPPSWLWSGAPLWRGSPNKARGIPVPPRTQVPPGAAPSGRGGVSGGARPTVNFGCGLGPGARGGAAAASPAQTASAAAARAVAGALSPADGRWGLGGWGPLCPPGQGCVPSKSPVLGVFGSAPWPWGTVRRVYRVSCTPRPPSHPGWAGGCCLPPALTRLRRPRADTGSPPTAPKGGEGGLPPPLGVSLDPPIPASAGF